MKCEPCNKEMEKEQDLCMSEVLECKERQNKLSDWVKIYIKDDPFAQSLDVCIGCRYIRECKCVLTGIDIVHNIKPVGCPERDKVGVK